MQSANRTNGNGSRRWYGTATDIDDIKAAEQRIRESEQRFSMFMHHLPGLAWIKDKMGRYVYVNEAAENPKLAPTENALLAAKLQLGQCYRILGEYEKSLDTFAEILTQK